MPRIDPLQLLTCLSVLLTPEGGILSRDQVPRLVNLMTKFSKKLVSKCVYVLILKSTETELVDLFMAEGGWSLIQTWLQDAVQTSNWDLVKEILGLLLVTPVDVERLKLNILPKLIKSLSRREDLEGVAQLSTQLVQRWLMIVKGTAGQIQQQVQNQEQVQSDPHSQVEPLALQTIVLKVENENKPVVLNDEVMIKNEEKVDFKIEAVNTNPDEGINPSSFYKTSDKDGKLLIKKFPHESKSEYESTPENTEKVDEKRDIKEKEKNRSKISKSTSSKNKVKEKDDTKSAKDAESEKEKSKKKSSSTFNKHKCSSSRNKDEKDRDKHRDKGKDKEKYRERDKSKEVDKEKHRSNGALKSSSTSSRSSKDRKDYKDKDKGKEKGKHDEKKEQVEKDCNPLEKSKSLTIDKLGRIPKKIPPTEEKTKDNSFEIRKKSFSVGIRKDKETDERPKTVKVFNSKMRSTGLEEEVKPAPPRSAATNKKPTPSVQLPTIPQKRPSPPKDIRDAIVPPEKKLKMDKIDVPERPGAIKLIPPKPKPVLLLESDLFNDALTAASSKKELKKRKRRPSVTKDNKEVSSPTTSVPVSAEPSQISTSPQHSSSSPSLALKNIAPINFYQDTLTEESEDSQKANEDNTENDNEIVEKIRSPVREAVSEVQDTPSSPPKTPTDEQDDEPLEHKKQKIDGGLKGVLLYTKKKGPKKSITWRAETDLVEVRYFELDETERVNVSRNFGDMAKMELTSEREALQMRKIIGEDVMEPLLPWRVPFPIDLEEPLAIPGSKSKEKDIQFAREKSVLPALYFDKNRIPDSPEEPIPENHQMIDPLIIPLDDPESQEIDLKSTPWPEPKGMAPFQEAPQIHPQTFGNVTGSFNQPFNNLPPPAFQGMPPRFPVPVNAIGPIGHLGPGNFGPANLNNLPNNIIGPPHIGHGSQELININMNPSMNLNMNPNMNPNLNPNINPNMFSDGPGPDKFRQGQDFPIYNNHTPPNNINNLNNMPNHLHNNLYQHQPPQHHNNYNNHRPNRGGFRRGGQGGGGNSGNWVRVNSNSWNNKRGGGGNRGGRICKNVQIHGYCRNIDNCTYVHP